ncbi:MAG: hypothetical protein IJU23_08440 [Proteobacteria bacterium]|nr:hypothetical protein [Pseudomonadota bacterium]
MKNRKLYLSSIFLITALSFMACDEKEDKTEACDCTTGAHCTAEEKAACSNTKTCNCETGENCTDAEKAACNNTKTCNCETGENCTDAEKAACNNTKTCNCETGENCTDEEKAACPAPEPCNCETRTNCDELELVACDVLKQSCDCKTGNHCTEAELAACPPNADCNCETGVGCNAGNVLECAKQMPCNCQSGMNCTDAEAKACKDAGFKCDADHSNIYDCTDNVLLYCDKGTGYATHCGENVCTQRGCSPSPCKGKCGEKEYCDTSTNSCKPYQCSDNTQPTCSEDGTTALLCMNGNVKTMDCHIEVPGLNYTTQYATCVDGDCTECTFDGYYCNGRVSYNCENHTLYETMCDGYCDKTTGQCAGCNDGMVWVDSYHNPYDGSCVAFNACAYPIRTVQDLMQIKKGIDYVLMNDITITKEDHYKAPSLEGRFIGNHHTITYHLEADEYSENSHENDPYLFSYTSGGEITSLKLDMSFTSEHYQIDKSEPQIGALAKSATSTSLYDIDANINYTIALTNPSDEKLFPEIHVGGLVGEMTSTNNNYTISNINVTGSMKFTSDNVYDLSRLYIGGYFGEYGRVPIHSVSSSIDIDVNFQTSDSSYVYIGGVIGWAEKNRPNINDTAPSFDNALHHIHSESNISVSSNAHILAGGVLGADLNFDLQHIYYKGNLNITTQLSSLNKKVFTEAGGIAGATGFSNVSNVYSEPNFTLKHPPAMLYVDTIGGITGYIQTGQSSADENDIRSATFSECTSDNTFNIILPDALLGIINSESTIRIGGITAKDYAIGKPSALFKDIAVRNKYNTPSLFQGDSTKLKTNLMLYGIIGDGYSTLDRVITHNSRNDSNDLTSEQKARLDKLIYKDSIGGTVHSNLCYYLDTPDASISSYIGSQGSGTKYQPSELDAIVDALNQDATKQGVTLLDGWKRTTDSEFITPNISDKSITGYSENTQVCSN